MTQADTQLETARTTSSRGVSLVVVIVMLALGVWLWRVHGRFDWASLPGQFHTVSWLRVGLAVALIYAGYVLRAWRWSVLLAPVRKTPFLHLLPAQLIGFTAVAIFGRAADLARPYLIARRLHTAIATQVAVYSIERAFDLAAAAILFSLTLAFAPHNTPHHQTFARAGAVSLAATLLVVMVALLIRFAGETFSRLTERTLRPLSPRFAAAMAARMLDLRAGFRTISTVGEFISALAISLAMWIGMAGSYLLSATAFRGSPQLAGFSVAATMLLLATSMGGSLLQLPVLGWFTQIAVLAAALHGFFAVPLETATACAVILLVVTSLCAIPVGFIAARLEGVGLRSAAASG
jgi:uncharacterized membrane protein YbhN (UPF0104 family)